MTAIHYKKVQSPFRRLLLLAAMSVALAAASCGGGDGAATSAGVLNRGLGVEPESLDPHKSRSSEAGDVQRDIGEGLTGYTADGRLEPRAARAWEVSESGLEYRFLLRPEARWSNGEPVTAGDFVYSFRRLVDPATAAFYSQSIIDVENAAAIVAGEQPVQALGVEAPGEHELVIRLRRPTPYFLALLTHPSMFPVHRGSIGAHGDAHARPGNLVSNGAYRLTAWSLGSVIELERNPHYWNDQATSIDRVRYVLVPEAQVELNRYRAGELHITDQVPLESFAQVRTERPDELRVAPYLSIYYYGLNLTRPPFRGNRELRRALSMAIDREILTELILGRGEVPAWGWVPQGVDNYEGQRFSYADMPREERHSAALAAYEAAGYSREQPLEVEIRYNTSETHQRIALAIQSMWREVLGVEATLINEEFQVLLSNMRAMEVTEVFRSSWSGDYNDAHTFLDVLRSDASSNMTGYASEEYDALMARAAGQKEPGVRRGYLQEAERVLLRDHPVLPIYFIVSKHLVSPQVAGWEDNVLDYHYSQHLSLAGNEGR